MFRELNQRNDDGVTVTLEWDPDTDRVQVRCEEEHGLDRSPTCFSVEPCDARFAFRHPSAMVTLEQIRSLTDNQPPEVDDPRGLADDHLADPDQDDEIGAVNDGRWRWYQWWVL